MQKLAIIGGGRMAGIFAENARKMGLETHCFSLEEGLIDKSLFDYIHLVNILNRKKVLEICKNINIDGVVATTELTIAVASYVAYKLGLKGMPFHVAQKITDKFRNRFITQNVEGLHHPKYAEVFSVEEIKRIGFSYPLILKPISKGGKRGITVIQGENEIESAFNYAMKDAGNALPLIVEEFIDGGMECSVESLSYDGKNYIIQVTEKITSGPPHCVELAHHQPARLSMEDRANVEKIVDRALTAIGINNSSCHTEIKVKEGKVYLIEFNARPGGDHIAFPLTELSTGYPYIKGAIQIALGIFQPLKKEQFVNLYAGVLFVTKQTAELKTIFNDCEKYSWCYKKNKVSDDLKSITHNDGFNINYFIYRDIKRPAFVQ